MYSVMYITSELAISLSHIFKCSIATGRVLEDWMIASVSVIHKTGPKKECGNYICVTPTSVLKSAKLWEVLVKYAIVSNPNRGLTHTWFTAWLHAGVIISHKLMCLDFLVSLLTMSPSNGGEESEDPWGLVDIFGYALMLG